MPRRLALLLPLLALVLVLARGAGGQAPPAPPTAQEQWGWSAGQPAAATAAALAPVAPVQIALPAEIAAQIRGETALLYFSPTCPHCRHAMPELNALARLQPELAFLGVASSRSAPEAIAEFRETFQVGFPVLTDTDGRFAWATGARSTPSLFLVQPAPAGATLTSGEPVPPDHAVVTVTEAWLPYSRGTAPIVAMRRNVAGRTVEGQVLPPDAYRDFRGYQGTRACAACHADETTSWALTHHAGALYTLYQRDRAEDLACVGCHVTGFAGGTDGAPNAWAQPGGYALGDHSSALADVGCEACHGPAGPHDGDARATEAGGDATAACVGCHDAKHSIGFTVQRGMPWIDHYAARTLSDDELRARLQALADGTAARPMLAFQDGPTVGAEACRECHKAEHRGWRGQHARAMESLGADATRGECVACHATPLAYAGGAPSTRVEDHRVDEGVGCEACHGPGGAHAAEPRLDNILRLGETCPECVLEGLCTSCHTAEWDPGWQLQERVDALPYD